MNIAHIEEHSFIYGPGCRFVIWVQGCSIRCNGCWNQEMWPFQEKTVLSVQGLLQKIESERDYIEGITLLGGEPLDQFEDVVELLNECRKSELGTMLFTGYEMSEIVAKKMGAILDNTDILITGRYDKTKRTLYHQWIGSVNQQIHFLTNRYRDFKAENSNQVEISISGNGSMNIYGFPDSNFLELNNLYHP